LSDGVRDFVTALECLFRFLEFALLHVCVTERQIAADDTGCRAALLGQSRALECQRHGGVEVAADELEVRPADKGIELGDEVALLGEFSRPPRRDLRLGEIAQTSVSATLANDEPTKSRFCASSGAAASKVSTPA